jgi:hypothetical protein
MKLLNLGANVGQTHHKSIFSTSSNLPAHAHANNSDMGECHGYAFSTYGRSPTFPESGAVISLAI